MAKTSAEITRDIEAAYMCWAIDKKEHDQLTELRRLIDFKGVDPDIYWDLVEDLEIHNEQ